MNNRLFRKGIVLGIILLFVGIAIQPSIIADDSFKSDNSEIVEITIQICNENGANDHTVMLTQEQAEELENIISTTKIKLDAAKTLEETSAIFNDTVVSLFELGVLPECMSIENAKRLVNGMDQNPRIVKKLERWFSRNQGNKGVEDNFLCLIAGHTDLTLFIGPSLIPILLLILIITMPLILLFKLSNIHFFPDNLFKLLIIFGGLNFLTWQFIPIAVGHIIFLGGSSGGMFPIRIPADGWINTIGLLGITNWNSFYGQIFGFTGIKICYPPAAGMTHFYMGAALMVNDW